MPTLLFLEITALQHPISLGKDENGRAQMSFNLACKVNGALSKLEEGICKIIQDAGLATLGTDMWFGSLAQIPPLPATGPFTVVIPTGGFSPQQTHDDQRISRPNVQIFIRAIPYSAARDKADTIHAALDGKHNLSVTV